MPQNIRAIFFPNFKKIKKFVIGRSSFPFPKPEYG